MKRVLRVMGFGNGYQIYDFPRLEKSFTVKKEKDCADAITGYLQRHPGTTVEFEHVSSEYKARISKLAGI